MDIFALFFLLLFPVGITGLIIMSIVIGCKRMSNIAKRTSQVRDDYIRAENQKQTQAKEYSEKVDELNKEINKFVHVKCPFCGSDADVPKGERFTCEHCGFVSANILQ